MKEKELRSRIARHKIKDNVQHYEVIVNTQARDGQTITSRIFEVNCNHSNKTITIETIDISDEHTMD